MIALRTRLGTPIVFSLLIAACGGQSGDAPPSAGEIPEPIVTITPSPTPTPSPSPSQPPQASVTMSGTPFKDSAGMTECDGAPEPGSGLKFIDVSAKVLAVSGTGLIPLSHQLEFGDNLFGQSGGVAAGDYNDDGFLDVYFIAGDTSTNKLLENNGDGTFTDVASSKKIAISGVYSGPAFGDYDGDSYIDLFVGGVDGEASQLFRNIGPPTFEFENVTQQSGLGNLPHNNLSATWGDYDSDGDLDLVIAHWTLEQTASTNGLWRNNGDGTFSNVSISANVRWRTGFDWSFTPNFSDINNDGLQDLLFVADGDTSAVFVMQPEGYYINYANSVISDKSGMGSALGDFDNDGDIDWFVSSISHDEPNTSFGNRLYMNIGGGFFEDATEMAGVREGFWGWAACAMDFNNDGYLDIFHVNGMLDRDEVYENDPSRLFISKQDGTFSEMSVESGIDDRSMGRGIVCFDYDRDGDQDILISNYNQAAKLFCNNGNANSALAVKINWLSSNSQGLGTRISITLDDGSKQLRELRVGNNYVSHNPAEVYFGVAENATIATLTITWPDGAISEFNGVEANQLITIERR